MNKLAFIFLSVALSACSINSEGRDALYVGYDEGGVIHNRAAQIDRLNAQGKQVVIGNGAVCISACTMYLGAENVCVKPNAYLGFHGAISFGEPGVKDGEYWTDYMADYYPPALRDWFYRSGASDLKVVWMGLSGRQVAKMGVPLCDED